MTETHKCPMCGVDERRPTDEEVIRLAEQHGLRAMFSNALTFGDQAVIAFARALLSGQATKERQS